jgi:hypothetical protein
MVLTKNGPNFEERFSMLNEGFDEIDFASNSFNTADHDFCPVLKCKIKEDHGYSTFFNRSINRENFPTYALSIIYLNWFLGLAVVAIWIGTGVNRFELESSNKFFGIIEVNIKSILSMFSSFKNFMLSVLVFFTQISATITLQFSYLYLFAIGRKLTLREIRQPQLYTKSRQEILFIRKPRVRRDFQNNKMITKYFYEYSLTNNTMPIMMKNIVKFIFGIDRNFRSDVPVSGQKPRIGHQEYRETPGSDQ